MSKLMMLAGGIVDAGGGKPLGVSAYVVYSAGRESRIFKVKGNVDASDVTELPSATTIDLRRFRRELAEDLEPIVVSLERAGAAGRIAEASADWVCGLVRDHLRHTENLDVP